MNCVSCKFIKRIESSGQFAECRRFPPQPVEAAGAAVMWRWPPIKVDGWCGEFASSRLEGREVW